MVHMITYERSTVVNSEKYIGRDVHLRFCAGRSPGWLKRLLA
jgi:hypothetical protein